MLNTDTSNQPVWPSRKWWLVLGLIVICAAFLRYTGYNYSLPYIEHIDEPAYNLAGRMIIDFGSAKPLGMQGYPPGIIELNYVVLRFLQRPNTPPGSILGIVRLISITFSIMVVVVLALLTFRIATPLAGLFAAAFWTFTPQIVEYSRYATADNFVTFFTILAFFLVITGTRHNFEKWIYAGSVASSFAVIFKYQAVFVLPILVAFPLLRLWQPGVSRWKVLKCFITNMSIQAIFFAWLALLYPATEATSAPDWSAPVTKLAIPSAATLVQNLNTTIGPFSSTLGWAVGLLGIGLFLWKPLRGSVAFFALIAIFVAAFAWLFGVSLYGPQGFRQFIAVGAFLTMFRAVGLTGFVELIRKALQYRASPTRQARLINFAPYVVAVLVLLSLIPGINNSVANAYQHTLPDHRNDLTTWADISLASGQYIAPTENHKTFNTAWGGYTGTTQFPITEVANLDKYSIEAWRAKGVIYAITPYGDYEKMKSSADGHVQLDQMTLLKTFPPNPNYRGPDMAVFRLFPIQRKLDGTLGPIRILGYDLDRNVVRPGGSITFTLYWQAVSPPDADYTVFNHFVKAKETTITAHDMVAQIDGPPLSDVRRPTNTWTDPGETLMSRTFTITLADYTPAGTYKLITGFYSRASGSRLLSPDSQDSVEVARILVVGAWMGF